MVYHKEIGILWHLQKQSLQITNFSYLPTKRECTKNAEVLHLKKKKFVGHWTLDHVTNPIVTQSSSVTSLLLYSLNYRDPVSDHLFQTLTMASGWGRMSRWIVVAVAKRMTTWEASSTMLTPPMRGPHSCPMCNLNALLARLESRENSMNSSV